MNEIKYNKITKETFKTLNENDLMFITNPGRMGDEDGSTFVLKKENTFIVYRVSGWMYGEITEDLITFDDMTKQFPKWKERWDNWENKEYDGKYKYVYMGFGNGLSVDKNIYDDFYQYLLEEAKTAKLYNEEDGENYNPCINFGAWKNALLKYAKENNINIK